MNRSDSSTEVSKKQAAVAVDHVFFKPFCGDSYGTPKSIFRNRVLIVGASHYCEGAHECLNCGTTDGDDNCRLLTNDVINIYLEGKKDRWGKTFTAFINSVLDRDSTSDDQCVVADSVVFYNYLQKAEGKDPDESHPDWYFEARHRLAFIELLHAHAPDVVIVWGAKAWSAIPADLGFGQCTTVADDENVLRFPFDGRSILLANVHHPSMFYSQAKHRAFFKELGILREPPTATPSAPSS